MYSYSRIGPVKHTLSLLCLLLVLMFVPLPCAVFSLAGGCDPNLQVVQAKGKTAMHAAAGGGYVDIIACLRLVKLY